jgi:Fic family protein
MSLLSITDTRYFSQYQQACKPNPAQLWQQFCNLEEYPTVAFARQSSAVFSSQIEGVEIDLNFYLNSRLTNAQGVKAETRRTLDWVRALEDGYAFAETHVLSRRNFLKVHFMISKFMDDHRERGVYRRVPVVIGSRTRIVYRALPPEEVAPTMEVFWRDMKTLRKQTLSPEAALYHASLIHLVFEKIHPFADGNGRIGRLLEKWFLAQHCGKIAWKVSSEAYYEQMRPAYYANLRALGASADVLNFDHCLPFLQMLPEAIRSEIADLS